PTVQLSRDKSRSFFSRDSFADNLILSSSPKGDESGTVALVDTKNPDSALSSIVHARRVTGFAFSAHSSPLLASISEDCTVAVLNSDLSEVFRSRSHRDFVKGLSWSPSDNALLTTVGWDHQVLHHAVPIPTGEASGINCVKE
ncbi:hypothetical protein CIB84_013787, partial [Bambusicola thoracicus]